MYVEIQGYKSKVKHLGPKSIIQGSKLTSILYTIYTLDISKINNIMSNRTMHKAVKGIEVTISDNESHEAVAYVDDLTQIVGNKNVMLLQEFIQKNYNTTVSYFKSNLLAINCPKTEIMMVP